jgi:protein-S-isoprenylcysteine O-methyltransferase Ste14
MNSFAQKIFKYRSYTPLPFVLLMVIFQQATITSLIVGFIIALFGESWRLWGVSYAGSETRTTSGVGGTFLVVTGPYAYVRNPLYLGNMLMYFGIGIMSMSLFPYLQIIALLFFFWQYTVIINEEENFLKGKFERNYKNYLNAVPKLIPGLIKYKNPGLAQPPFEFNKGIRSEKRTFQAFGAIILLIIIRYIIS